MLSNKGLLSAPNEKYKDHVKKCLCIFNKIFPKFEVTIERVFKIFDVKSERMKKDLEDMVKFHDLGKLTEKWQEEIRKSNPKLPSHASIGACYLWKRWKGEMDDLRYSVVFAVAIHHTDRGLLGDNVERPDVQAIEEWIIDFKNDKVKFVKCLSLDIRVEDLRSMAEDIRKWSRSGSILEQHKKRIQVALVHHILKVCDVVAAKKGRFSGASFTRMVDEIYDYYNKSLGR